MARLWPREHGAYVQLLAPLLAAFLASGATGASILFGIGGCLAFLANEPLLVILGHRGRRVQDQAGASARWALVLLVPLALAAGAAGFALGSAAARVSAALLLGPAAVLMVLAWRRQERSLVGELVAAVVLTGAALPTSIAAGMRWQPALAVWAAWALGYASTVLGVHRVIARHRRGTTRGDRAVGVAMVSATLVVIASAIVTPHALVALPLVASSTVLVLWPPPATRLRAIGAGLVAASLVSIAFVVVGS